MKVSFLYFWRNRDSVEKYDRVHILECAMLSLSMQWNDWDNRKTSPLYPSTHEKIGEQEVFLGSIIRVNDEYNYEVVYCKGMYQLDGYDSNGDYIPALGYVLETEQCEIVGHVFTDPQLLENKVGKP